MLFSFRKIQFFPVYFWIYEKKISTGNSDLISIEERSISIHLVQNINNFNREKFFNLLCFVRNFYHFRFQNILLNRLYKSDVMKFGSKTLDDWWTFRRTVAEMRNITDFYQRQKKFPLNSRSFGDFEQRKRAILLFIRFSMIQDLEVSFLRVHWAI